jgi:hypothetical protein
MEHSYTVSHKKGPHGLIIIVTDTDILGKYFHENNLQLDLRSVFYKGEEMDEEKTKVLIRAGYIVHFTGTKSVDLGVRLNLIDKKNILIIQNIPHAEVITE